MPLTLERRKQALVQINKSFLSLYDIACRYMVCYGGRGSSKSWSVSQLVVRRGVEYPDRNIVVMRKVAATIRLSVWKRIMNALNEAGVLQECDINKTERVITLPNGSTINFIGADDPEKLKSLEGATDFWLEETNEFDEIDLDTIDAGLRANVNPICQIWMTFNPVPMVEAFIPWLASRFVNRVPHVMSVPAVVGDVCVMRSWYKDNAYASPAMVKLFKNYEQNNPELYKLWVLGLYTFLEGVIFKNWDVVDKVPEEAKYLGYGVDWGFADDPAAVVKVYQTKDEMWLDEVVYATDLTNPQLSMMMENGGLKKHTDSGIGDASEPKDIQELRNLGWSISKSDKAPNYKLAAIYYIKSFKVHLTKRSVNGVKEFSTWSWKKDKVSGKFLPIPVDGNDHFIDSTIGRVFTKRFWGVLR